MHCRRFSSIPGLPLDASSNPLPQVATLKNVFRHWPNVLCRAESPQYGTTGLVEIKVPQNSDNLNFFVLYMNSAA